jgi:phage N-6-adenine-methyltransferase
LSDFDANRFKSTNQAGETPLELFNKINNEFHFTLDVCADDANHKVDKYFTEKENALIQDWGNNVCWMNPPYKNMKQWIVKAYQESLKGATVVCLVPSRTNTNWWHEYCMKGEIRFIKGRPKFKGYKHGLPQPLSIVIFRPNQYKQPYKAI